MSTDKESKEHECKTQIHRVDRYSIISGGGWFVEGHREKIDIEYCPYCGIKLPL